MESPASSNIRTQIQRLLERRFGGTGISLFWFCTHGVGAKPLACPARSGGGSGNPDQGFPSIGAEAGEEVRATGVVLDAQQLAVGDLLETRLLSGRVVSKTVEVIPAAEGDTFRI